MTRGMISALATTGTEIYGVPDEVDAGPKASRQASREAVAANKHVVNLHACFGEGHDRSESSPGRAWERS